MWHSDEGIKNSTSGVRAVIYLESDATLTKSGTSSWTLN